MRFHKILSFAFAAMVAPALAQTNGDFHLALPEHNGQLNFSAPGYEIVQYSARPNGDELGLRGSDAAGEIHFLVFLFDLSQKAPLTGAKCRDGEMGPEQKANHSLKILASSEITNPGALPVSLVDYSVKSDSGKQGYMARGFIAEGDLCGDLEFYSDRPIHASDDGLRSAFASLKLDLNYAPEFKDTFLYAQILFDDHLYAGAGPIYELALQRLAPAPGIDVKTMTRVLTDQAGMSYGISGNIAKARAIFDNAIATDPDYPMYYYNLACADAEVNKLADARAHLQEAFDRKANMIPGEKMPDPTQDDSFTPYRTNKEFWTFVKSLRPQ
jgi:tetratricopeptide (TPR) repeat protein